MLTLAVFTPVPTCTPEEKARLGIWRESMFILRGSADRR